MGSIARLVTCVEIADDGADPYRMSLSARHEAVLSDGRRVVLLDGRGWSAELRVSGSDDASERERDLAASGGIWAHETAEEIERTARSVVGPDEPYGARTEAEMEASHWEWLIDVLAREGVQVRAAELRSLPHDVELGARVRARLQGRGAY